MTERERLIELIHDFGLSGYTINDLVNHLIANGVKLPVRCEDCKHYNRSRELCTLWSGDPYEMANTNKTDYCSYGERKDNG